MKESALLCDVRRLLLRVIRDRVQPAAGQPMSAMPPIATKNGEPLKRRRANGYNFSNRFPQTPPVVETSAMHPLILLTFSRQLRKLG
jgi:hypothetical protein